MKNLLRFLAFVLMVGSVYAQSNLPACQGRDAASWNNCLGTEVYPAGSKYVGEFINGKPHGQGTFLASNGTISAGIWADGKFLRSASDQQAISVNQTVAISTQQPNISQSKLPACPLRGFFNNCFASYTFPNGFKYVGAWKENKYHGQGTLFASNGSVISEGIWADGNFVRSAPVQQANAANQMVATATQQPNISQSNLPACPSSGRLIYCFGTYTYPSGNKYVGEFSQDKRNGQGIFYSSSGSIISQGIWSYDNLVQPALIQEASVANQTLPAVALQTDSSERDRLLAEVEAERKKRQELEEQLRVAQQSTKPNKQPVTSSIERRVALVIGNSTYRVNPLDNPANDATDITTALNKVGCCWAILTRIGRSDRAWQKVLST